MFWALCFCIFPLCLKTKLTNIIGTISFIPYIYRKSRERSPCFFLIYLFIFGCTGSSLLCRLFSSCNAQGLLSRCNVWAFHFDGLSCCGAQPQGCTGFSSCLSQALEYRLNSCGTQAELSHGMWDLPRLGVGPVSPALAGGFFTTEPPG